MERDSHAAPCWSRRVAVTFALLAVVLAGIAMPVAGHAYLDDSSPESGERVESVPAELVLEFGGERIQIADVSVIGPGGDEVASEVRIDGADRSSVRATLADDGEGIYTVRWEVLSDDGHGLNESFYFIAGEEELDREQVLASNQEPDDDAGSPLESLLKGLLLVGVVGLVGVPVTVYGAVLPAVSGTAAAPLTSRRTGRLLVVLGTGTFLTALALGAVRVLDVRSGFTLADVVEFVGVPLGRVWLAQSLTALVGVGALLFLRRRDADDRWLLGVATATGLGVAVAIAWSSHSATLVDRVSGAWFDTVHLVGAGLWVGGLAALALVALPAVRVLDGDVSGRVAMVVERFSLAAITGVVLAILTGTGLLAWHVPSVEALTGTRYGGALTVKIGLLLVAFGVGGFARAVVLRRIRRGSTAAVSTLRTSVRFELAALVAVLLVSGLATSMVPAAVVSAHDDPVVGTLNDTAGDLETTVAVVPGGETVNGAFTASEAEPTVIDVHVAREGEPVAGLENTSIDLYHSVDDVSQTLTLESIGNGTYSAVHEFSTIGTWEMSVDIQGSSVNGTTQFDTYVVSAEHARHTPDAYGETTSFSETVQTIGLVIGLAGLVAFAYEARVLARRQE